MNGPLVLDLHKILRQRLPSRVGKLVPGFAISWMEKLIRQEGLNEILRVTYPSRGSEFSSKVLRHLDISVEVEGLESLPDGRRYMFASNHPLGGLDGIALIWVLGKKYGDDKVRFLVNDMLMNVEPLREMFLPVNKFGAQGRGAVEAINAVMESDMQVLQFPAGLVSRLHDDGSVSDLEWQKAFVTKAIEYRRDIVPVRFVAANSPKFYKTARRRKKLGIKFNIEQILLPAEIFKSKSKNFRIIFGKPISWEELKSKEATPKALAAEIRSIVYRMGDPEF